jgi:transcriptional regulator with XRE-family HTH domain
MPAKIQNLPQAVEARLIAFGAAIRKIRRSLGISAAATAGAAGISRVTLHRIEGGEQSVTIGAYLNVLEVLGLADVLRIAEPDADGARKAEPDTELDLQRVAIDRYPQLESIAWHITGMGSARVIPGDQALAIYERNWRHVDKTAMTADESRLVAGLVKAYGNGVLLV